MFRERIIVDDSLVHTPAGAELRVRLPWYRALPLSVIETLEVVIDDVRVDEQALRIRVNGGCWGIAEARQRWDEVWYVLDDATVELSGLYLNPASEHRCEVTLAVRIPYLPVSGRALVVSERDVKTMPATPLPVEELVP
ncbi:DUF6379 domain-containing protein [Nonomuraea sp. NPDC050328]|uniref:C-glycoside deglycosidase beta subunit domain-containing protein n=1 Tax=Nonomuraea sp. NPDC050328 TaxID=3364361 RepID=UPI0037B909EE